MARSILTLAELRQRDGYRGLAEELAKKCALMEVLPYVVEPKGEFDYGVRSRLPNGGFHLYGEGVTRDTSETARYKETLCLYDSPIWVPSDGAMSGPEAVAVEAKAHLQKAAITFNTAFWYGAKTADPASMNGLSTRFPLLTTGGQVLNGGLTTGNSTSIWVLRINPEDGVHGFVQSAEDFLSLRYLGEDYDPDGTIKGVLGHKGHVHMAAGLVVRQANAACQICNLAVSGTSNVLTSALLTKAMALVPGWTHIFANSTGLVQCIDVAKGNTTASRNEFLHTITQAGNAQIWTDECIVDSETVKTAA